MSTERVYAKETRAQHSEESILYSVDFTPCLGDAESLTGQTPTAEINPSTGVTVGSAAVNSSTFENGDGETVAAGKGVTVRVSGLTATTEYVLKVKCATSASNTFVVLCQIRCEA